MIFHSCRSEEDHDDSLIFRFNADSGISSLDPAFARDQYKIWACNQIYTGLVQLDDHLKVQPAIAKSWEISDSGKTYTFRLRDDVFFHENECFGDNLSRRVVSSDFKFSFERLMSSSLAAPGSWVFSRVAGFESPDDRTLIIRLKHPFPPFLSILSMQYCSVIAPEAVEYYGADFRSNPVGTGPFYKKLWVENEKLVLRRNDRYFEKDSNGESLPYLEAVAVSFIPDKQSAFMEFVKGNLDFISGIDASYKDELLTFSGELQERYQDKLELYRQPYLNTEYLAFLVDSQQQVMTGNPLLNVKVRKAINYGFDRRKMMRYLRNNIGTPAVYGMIPVGMGSIDHQKIKGYDYDPARAAQLLAEAGYPSGNGLPEIKLQTNASYLDLCEYIQGELAVLGIRLSVEVSPASTLRQAMATSKVPFFRASWIGDYPDAENYLSLFYSENWAPEGPNYTHFSSKLFDSWYRKAAQITNDSMRNSLYERMDSLVMSHAPVVPLYYDQVLRFYPKTVHGLEGNAMNLLDLKEVWKE